MTAPTASLLSRAEVATDSPDRYAKQLLAHLGRRIAFTTDGPTSTARVDEATASVVIGDRMLVLPAGATDQQSLERVEHVLGSHLERFGQRHELAVVWVRSEATA